MVSINYSAPINSMGYGYTGYYFLKSLLKNNVDITLFEIGGIENLGSMDKVINASFSQRPRHINNSAVSLRLWHQNDVHPRIGSGKHFGFPIFELDTFSDMEKYSMLSCDELIVCSQWAKDIIKANNINIPVSVVPLGYDPDIFTPPLEASRTGPTVFLNCGKWEYRKGHDVVLECFESAFTEDDDVELWMMCHNPFPYAKGEEWEQKYRSSKLHRKIRLISRQSSHKNVHYIMSKADCGLFPSRAEGWNLELLEMMACGKHIITTNYSAHTEFCNSDACRLIDINYVEKAVDNIWFHGTGNWASINKPEKDKIIWNMRDIHNIKLSGNLGINKAAVVKANDFTWDKSSLKLLDILSK